MERVSSITTYFKRKVIPYIIIANLIIFIVCLSVLDFKIEQLFPLIFPSLILILGWLLFFRRLKTVYLGKKHLKVDNELISFRDILSIEKLTHLSYKIYYTTKQQQTKSFVFNTKLISFITPYSIKKIKSLINK